VADAARGRAAEATEREDDPSRAQNGGAWSRWLRLVEVEVGDWMTGMKTTSGLYMFNVFCIIFDLVSIELMESQYALCACCDEGCHYSLWLTFHDMYQ